MSRLMLLAGGTGGHAMPALAVAEHLRASGNEVVWVGTRSGLEAKIARRNRFEFRSIHIKGIRQSGSLRMASMPFRLAWAMLQMVWIILRCKPDVILGMGGFISGPGGLVAALLRRPLVIHEQNTTAGLTNHHLARFAVRVLSGFPQVEGIANPIWTGNPVRRAIIKIPRPEHRLGRRKGPLRLLIVGGSQGAHVFNQHLPELLKHHPCPTLEIWHQCGQTSAGTIASRYLAAGLSCKVNGFIDDMAKAYAWCDLIICRGGAMSIAEVCAAGAAAILVPYPHAVNDHQSSNIAYLHKHGAAMLVPQQEFVQGIWLKSLSEFDQNRNLLINMAVAARQLAHNDAAEKVANACLEVSNA